MLAGGACQLCGYHRCIGALQFHHVDPVQKEFEISGARQTASFDLLVAEASKCVLLCATCHIEVELGYASVMHLWDEGADSALWFSSIEDLDQAVSLARRAARNALTRC